MWKVSASVSSMLDANIAPCLPTCKLTANHIYQVIGYPPGKDFADCRFAAA
jgi:hypothetical protein